MFEVNRKLVFCYACNDYVASHEGEEEKAFEEALQQLRRDLDEIQVDAGSPAVSTPAAPMAMQVPRVSVVLPKLVRAYSVIAEEARTKLSYRFKNTYLL